MKTMSHWKLFNINHNHMIDDENIRIGIIKVSWLMCKTHNPRRIDKCLTNLLLILKYATKYDVVASCCGHNKYPMTIVCRTRKSKSILEIMNMIELPMKKRYNNATQCSRWRRSYNSMLTNDYRFCRYFFKK